MDIILASSSPRRKELMKLIFDEFIIRPSEIEEDIPSAINYELAAEYLASKKANSVVKKSNELVIGCDTVVTAGNIILGKPHDCKECRKVLINNYDNVAMDGNKIELQGYQFLVIEM